MRHGCISITVKEQKTQFKNRQIAIHKLITLLKAQLTSNTKIRKITKPTKASKKRRIESKKKRGELNRNRQNTLEKDF